MKKTMSTQFLRHSGFLLVILLLEATLSLTMAHKTEAATLYVSPLIGADTGNCQVNACKTIQYAIDKASAGDTINLAQSTYTEAGITIYKDLTLQGESTSNTIVQAATTAGTASDRVFRIKPGLTVSIKKITIRHGKNLYGGGIFIATKATVTINDSVITKNSTSYNGRGGGIYVADYGTLKLNNSTVSHNTTAGTQWTGGDGGGIYSGYHAFVWIKNSTITSNSAEWDGGGIETTGPWEPYPLLLIDKSTISQNHAYYGGGIFNEKTKTVIVDSAIYLNDADSRGGGIFNGGSKSMSLINSTIADNKSYIGAGIYNEASLWIEQSTISGNTGTLAANGIRNMGTVGNSLGIHNSTISNNGIANSGETRISNSTLFNAYVSNFNIMYIKSTIIANNVSGYSNCYGAPLTVSGNNLSTDSSCKGFTQVTLAQLKLGGPSPFLPGKPSMYFLQPTSVAIDTASDCNNFYGHPVTTDQRGVSRPFPAGGKCDIGAHEYAMLKVWLITPNGGTIHLPDGTASFFFPPEAVSDDVLVNIDRWLDDELLDPPPFIIPPPPEGWQRVGAAYDVKVYDVEENPIRAFHRLVEMLLRYNPEEIDGISEQSMVIHFYEPEIAEWIPLPSEINPDEHTVTSSTEHPGLFGLFGVPESPEVFDSPLTEEISLDRLSSLDIEEYPSTKFEEPSELMPSSIPEPATAWILGIGLGLLMVIKRIINTRK